MQAAGAADSLVHVAAEEWTLQCNWKVFVDNYLVRVGPCAVEMRHWLPAYVLGADVGYGCRAIAVPL